MESDIWKKPPLYFKLWHYLLLKAQHSDYKNLKRGQLWTSIPEIREAMSYYSGYRKVTPTEKEVRCAIDWLRNPYGGKNGEETEGSMIVTTRGVHGILVTICNYNKYQGYEFYEGRDEGRDGKSTEVTRRSEQGRYINKNDKNDKNDKNVNNHKASADAIEPYTDNAELNVALEEFIAYRKKIKKPMTDRAVKLLIGKLEKLSPDVNEQIEILNESIVNGWQGVFPLKKETSKANAGVLDGWGDL